MGLSFVHLHCHSSFSFHAGVPGIPEIVGRARELGMPAVGLTDTDRMSGLVLHYEECRRQGLRPVLGVELTEPRRGEVLAARARRGLPEEEGLAAGPDAAGMSPRADGAGSHGRERLVVLARNAKGYADLCEVVTRRHLEADRFRFEEVFAREWPDFVLLTASPGLLGVLAGTPNRDRLYGELIGHSAATRRRSRELEAVARALDLPLVAQNDCYFLHPGQWSTHQLLTAIGLNSTLSRLRPGECASPQACLRSADQMAAAFPSHRRALATAERLAEECGSIELPLGEWILPRVDVPRGETPASHLERLAWAGLERNYGGRGTCARARRIQRMELDTIEKLGYPSYFLIVKEIRDWANGRFASGYRRPTDCTILRGSAANSITFYNIGVSDLDPIRHDLYFQRFLNEDRASPPDADLDFGWDERDEVQRFITRRWGEEHVAVTCTTHHFRGRAAFRETAKVHGYTDDEVTRILRSHKSREARIDDAGIRRLWELAATIRGKPRFLGQHPGGVLITDQPMRRHVACERSGGEKDRVITQIDMHNGIDELGLIQVRHPRQRLALGPARRPGAAGRAGRGGPGGLRRGQVLRRRRRAGRHPQGPDEGDLLHREPGPDAAEQEGPGRDLRGDHHHLQPRAPPAGSRYAATYVERERKRQAGIRDWDFVHPALEAILGRTHDVCVFQEDVTKICHQVAGLSFAQADRIRKMMNSLHEGAPAEAQWRRTERDFLAGCMSPQRAHRGPGAGALGARQLLHRLQLLQEPLGHVRPALLPVHLSQGPLPRAVPRRP